MILRFCLSVVAWLLLEVIPCICRLITANNSLICTKCTNMHDSASKGHVQCMIRFLSDASYWPRGLSTVAAVSGQLRFLQFLNSAHYQFDSGTIQAAAANGHIDLILWMDAAGIEAVASDLYDHAAERGKLNVMHWLSARGLPFTSTVTSSAAFSGSLACLEWFVQNGATIHPNTARNAAPQSLDCLKFAHAHGCDINHCFAGSLDTAIWLLENGAIVEESHEKFLPAFAHVLTKQIMAAVHRHQIFDAKAKIIQRAWIDRYYNPGHHICQKRLRRQFLSLSSQEKRGVACVSLHSLNTRNQRFQDRHS